MNEKQITVEGLVEYKKSLEVQLKEIQETIRATEVLIQRLRIQNFGFSSNGITSQKSVRGLSVFKATRAIVNDWKEKEFTSSDVFQEFVERGYDITDANINSVKAGIGGALNVLWKEKNILDRRNIAETGRSEFQYRWRPLSKLMEP